MTKSAADTLVPNVAVPAVAFKGITKRFGAIIACDQVNLTLNRGQIHGICGENGAGKSTLMNMLLGIVLPDAGTIEINGTPTVIADPQHAAKLGIGMVHQHFSLVNALSVAENVMLGDLGKFDLSDARRRVAELSDRYGMDVPVDAQVGDLSPALRQRVEIIKCLRRNPSILIFDEPTSALTMAESEVLFRVLRQTVQEDNSAAFLVSHKLPELQAASDEISIMHSATLTPSHPTQLTQPPPNTSLIPTQEDSVRATSSNLESDFPLPPTDQKISSAPRTTSVTPPALEVTDLRTQDPYAPLDGLTLTVAQGEIVGLLAAEGNGQTELVDVLSGLVKLTSGTVKVNGLTIDIHKPGAATKAGIAIVTEDRHDAGCVLNMTVAENLHLTINGSFKSTNFKAKAQELIDEFEIHGATPDTPFWALSGGNQQRAILAREISSNPSVLVAAQPMKGLDAAATEWMTQRLRNIADSGVGVLLISPEPSDLTALADRVLALKAGKVVDGQIAA